MTPLEVSYLINAVLLSALVTMEGSRADKAPWLDGLAVECLKKFGMTEIEWIVRLLNISFDRETVQTCSAVEAHPCELEVSR